MTHLLKWFLHHWKGLLVDQERKESRLEESHEKEVRINAKGASSLDILRRVVTQLKLN
jgi:hypothetical protein